MYCDAGTLHCYVVFVWFVSNEYWREHRMTGSLIYLVDGSKCNVLRAGGLIQIIIQCVIITCLYKLKGNNLVTMKQVVLKKQSAQWCGVCF